MKASRFSISRFAVPALILSLFWVAASAQTTAPGLTAYFGVKDALVATDAAKAKIQVTTLSAALGNADAARLSAADRKKCIVPECDGVPSLFKFRDKLWDNYFTAAPAQRR